MNLKELARTLGLSPTTVSRALNGYPEVSSRTREKVQAAAALHGYVPNHQAQRLATGQTKAIGHVLSLAQNDMINPIFGDFIAGAGEAYAELGYDMVVSVAREGNEEEAYRTLVARNRVDGVVLHSPTATDARIALLAELDIPFVVHGVAPGVSSPYSWLDINNFGAFERATKLLIDLGHERIALLNGPKGMSFATDRLAGFTQAMNKAELPIEPGHILHASMTEPYGFDSTTELMARPDAPTAFLSSSMMTTIGVYRALGQLGLEIGRDVSLVTHDDMLSFLPNSGDVPQFTCTRSSVRRAGHRVVEMLISQITEKTEIPMTELWEADLVLGRSTGPAPSHRP